MTRSGLQLGQRYQGRGFGAQMRAAALHLAFDCPGAQRAMSTTFADSAASRRVSQKFGYEPNGVRLLAVDQRLVEAHDDVLTPPAGFARLSSPLRSMALRSVGPCLESLPRPRLSMSCSTCSADGR
ncbi:GNAT family N-acetyltransferase [Streptomyces sp. NPDC054855]